MATGDLMIVRDHINLLGESPLMGPNDDDMGPRFPGMNCAYDSDLTELVATSASELGLNTYAGVYLGMNRQGERSAALERIVRKVDAQAVGEAIVAPVIAAVHGGIPVVAISVISNTSSCVLDGSFVTIPSAQSIAERAEESLRRLLPACVGRLAA
jgi:purine-nucleoside phosphorylase